jgi:hypothetical protein
MYISLNIFRFHYIRHCPQTFEVQVLLLLVQKLDEAHILPTHQIENTKYCL